MRHPTAVHQAVLPMRPVSLTEATLNPCWQTPDAHQSMATHCYTKSTRLMCATQRPYPQLLAAAEGMHAAACMQGADTVIFERLDTGNKLNEGLRKVTQEHMEDYGGAGLRTLCLACTELEPADYDSCALPFF